MRIAELVNNLVIGGAERMAVDLTLNLIRRGHQVTVVCLRDQGPLLGPLQDAGVEVISLEKRDGFSYATLRRLSGILRERNIELIHTHNPLVHHYGVLARYAGGARAVVSTVHGINNFQKLGKAEILFGVSSLGTDRIVAVCETAYEVFARQPVMRESKLAVIRNGIRLECFLAVPEKVRTAHIVFGSVGRLVPIKDFPTLLKGFALLQKIHPATRLEVLGDGPLRTDLTELARRLGIEDSVCFHGASLDVARFLARIDAFALSSTSEGLPLTVLEAMGAARPIVSTNVGGVPELVDEADCGWLCPPGQPERMAEVMKSAVECSNPTEVGRRGRWHVQKRYSLEAMTTGYESLFRSVLK